jgi:methionine-rich copper-binding protein CopC
MAAANFTNAQVFNQLSSGQAWSGATITYSFPSGTTGLTITDGEGNSFRAASAAQQAFFSLAIMTWDDLIERTMSLTTSTSSNIEFAYTTTGIDYAHAYFPTGGTVWFNAAESTLVTAAVGSYGFQTTIHEIGHALGLNHMGDYNGAGAFTPSSYQDSVVLSIMSYFGPSAPLRSSDVASADWRGSDNKDYGPQTPMLNDVMVIQQIYGTSTTTRLGDTIYGFSSNITGTAASIYDFSVNKNPILTIFDSGGSDTLNLSGWSSRSEIHLESGVFSSANDMTNNIVIAYSAVIENAVAGSGNDTLTGNAVGNRLDGGSGNDVLSGLDGDDTLTGGLGNDQVDGGAGTDTAVLAGALSSYTFTYDSLADLYTVSGASSGTDTFTKIEFFQFSDVLRAASQLISGDLSAPSLTSSNPVDNATAVAVGANLVLTFSEAVAAGTGNIEIHNSDGSVLTRIDVSDSTQVSVSGSTVTVNPSANLAAGSSYYITMASGVVKDLAGNAYAGISSTTTYNFSTAAAITGDTTAPLLSGSTPADNATGIAASANLVLTFSEAVQAGTGNVVIFNSDGSVARTIAITDTTQVSISGTAVTVNPATDLTSGSAYYVNLGSGVIKDLAGNAFAGISSTTALNFSTASATVADDFPWNTSTTGSVAVNGSASSGSIEVASDGDLLKVTLTAGTSYVFNLTRTTGGLTNPYLYLYSPSVALLAEDNDSGGSTNASITYTATASGTYYLGAADFSSGTGGYTLSARSGDSTAPTLSSSSPADNATAVAVGANIVLTFNEAVQAGSGNIVIYNSNGTVARSIAVTDSSQVSVSGSTVTINPSSDLASGSSYYVNLASGVVKDTGGNAYAGISSTTALNFTTVSTTATDDYPLSTSTTGVVVVNGAATTGVIDFVDDGDLFQVSLVKGQSYVFSATSVTGGLPDPYLQLYDKTGSPLTFDDDSGGGLNAQIVYTALETATYFLAAYDSASGLGRYSLTATAATDDYAWDTDTSGVVTVGGTAASGTINAAGDADLFKVTLTAGTSYVFELSRTSGGLTDPYLYLYSPSLAELSYDDDSGGSGDARISFTATASGTYYLGAMDFSTGTGAYTLSGRAGTAPSTTVGTSGADRLVGTSTADTMTGWGGNDFLMGNGGNDTIDGGSGIDHAAFAGSSSEYAITRTSSGLLVHDTLGFDGTDALTSIERLEFSDIGIALDMGITEAGGKSALLIGVLLGPAALSDLTLVGQVLNFFDDGTSLSLAASLMVSSGITASLAGGADNSHFVQWVYHNIAGVFPDANTAASLKSLLDQGVFTQASMLSAIAELPVNQLNVNLVGLAQNGMDYF